MIYPINNESIKLAKSLINDGEIIAYPTDTLYGFGLDEFIGIRVPKHDFPIILSKELKKPIVTTSINQTGKKPLNKIDSIESHYPEIAIFEDQNQNQNNSTGSTIIKLIDDEVLIRQGDGDFPL